MSDEQKKVLTTNSTGNPLPAGGQQPENKNEFWKSVGRFFASIGGIFASMHKTITQETRGTSALRVICSWFVGLVFIFSSITKGIDPLGTAYKVEEYMTAWDFFGISFTGFVPLAPFLSMALITLEFLVGVMLLTGSFRKLTSWLLLLMMTFFTFTTLYDAISNKVSDCGCFGDAVKLTNWQTFWKNIILDVPTLYIFATRKWPRKKKFERDIIIAIIAITAMILFGLRNINNEPIIDFRPWKIGNVMMDNIDPDAQMTCTVTYKNKATGEFKTMDSSEIPVDSVWQAEWEWVGTENSEDPHLIKADGFFVQGTDGQDYSFEVIGAIDGPILITTIHHIKDVNEQGVAAIADIKKMAEERGVTFVMLTNAEQKDVEEFLQKNNLEGLEYYFGDEKGIMAMMRSNPGFIVMRNARVKDKWHYRNVEKVKEFPFEDYRCNY